LTEAELGPLSYRSDRLRRFSSNRFALAHQIHKVDLQVELKEAIVNQLHATQSLKSSQPIIPSPIDVGARVAYRANEEPALNRFEKPATVPTNPARTTLAILIGELRSIIRRLIFRT